MCTITRRRILAVVVVWPLLGLGFLGPAHGAASDDPLPSTESVQLLPIVRGDLWRYFKGVSQPPSGWNDHDPLAPFDDATWLAGPSGFGYGDGDDGTVLSDMRGRYLSVFTRKLFRIPSASTTAGLEMSIDWDDGFVAFVNGQEVTRHNLVGSPGTHVGFATAASDHEASAGAGGRLPDTFFVPADLLRDGTNVIAVQAHNSAVESSDLSLIVELRSTGPPPPTPVPVTLPRSSEDVALRPVVCVDLGERSDPDLTVTFYGRRITEPPADPFTIIALPDTQFYAESHPETYLAQTRWILDNLQSRNIVFVTQLGDCVNQSDVEDQWIRADAAWRLIEDPLTTLLPDGVPYGIAVGNHDQFPGGDPGTITNPGATTLPYNRYFGITRFAGRAYYGGHYGDNSDNHFELFSAGGMDFLALHLEYMPTDTPLRRDVLAWAEGVLRSHPGRRAMLTSHYLMEWGLSTDFSDQGLATYEALKDNPNLFLMLAGHLALAQRRTDEWNGSTIHTLRSDYQWEPNGGNGWLRIMSFSPDDDTIAVETYSPTLGQSLTDPLNRFRLSYDMDGGPPFSVVGAIRPATEGSLVCVPWSGRTVDGMYQWYAEATDGRSTTVGPRAIVGGTPSRPPGKALLRGDRTGRFPQTSTP